VRISDLAGQPGGLSLHESSITDYLLPMANWNTSVFASGDLTCNWWGDITGPHSLGPVNEDVYKPWARDAAATDCTGGLGQAALAPFCPADADPETFEYLADAIDDVVFGGTVEVCSGTHSLSETIDKAITLEGAAGPVPTLTTTGTQFVLETNFTSGTATFRNLNLVSALADEALLLMEFDQVLVDNVDITVTDPGSTGILALPTAVAGAKVTIQNATITGGNNGVFADSLVVMDILNSSFGGQASSNIHYQLGAAGLVQGNTIGPCGSYSCFNRFGSATVANADSMRFVGNTLTATAPGQTQYAVRFAPGDLEYSVRNNVVTGAVPVGDRNVNSSYSFTNSGVWINFPVTSGDVSGNVISSARYGLRASGGFAQPTGSNNTISAVKWGIRISDGGGQPGSLAIHSSDITDFVYSMAAHGTSVFGTGDLTCNWWGDITGPKDFGSVVAADVYTPWATGSVAGTSTTSCSGGP
jgi:hypothetical protein